MLKALEPANTGYAMRQTVHSSVDTRIVEHDCGSKKMTRLNVITLAYFLDLTITKQSINNTSKQDKLKSVISNILLGRYDYDYIDYNRANAIAEELVENYKEFVKMTEDERQVSTLRLDVEFRSLATCNSTCSKCYGKNLSTWDNIDINAPVGVLAATSIGEVGTQLTMKAFQQGGKKVEMSSQKSVERILSIKDASDIDLKHNIVNSFNAGKTLSIKGRVVYIGDVQHNISLAKFKTKEDIDAAFLPGRVLQEGDLICIDSDFDTSTENIAAQDNKDIAGWLLTQKLFLYYYNAGVNIKHVEALVQSIRSYKIISNPNNNPLYSISYYLNKNQVKEATEAGISLEESYVGFKARELKDNSPLVALAYERTKEAIARLVEKREIKLSSSFEKRLLGRA